MLTRTYQVWPIIVLALFPALEPQKGKPKPDPQIKEAVVTLKKAYKKKKDDDAISAIDALTRMSQEAIPKDRKLIAQTLAAAYGHRRDDTRLHIAVTASLSTLGEDGAKSLLVAAKDKRFKIPDEKALAVRIEIVRSLGLTGSPAVIKPLLGLLNDKDFGVIAAATESLANFKEADQKTRKKIFNEILKKLTTAETNSLTNPNDAEAKRKYDTIGGPMLHTLQAMSGEDLRTPDQCQQWWNKNKKRSWDPE